MSVRTSFLSGSGFLLLSLALFSCTLGTSGRTGNSSGPPSGGALPPAGPLTPDYPRNPSRVSYEQLMGWLGPESKLSDAEKRAAWEEEAQGREVTWTVQMVELGPLRETSRTAYVRAGRSTPRWDTRVFFEPAYSERLESVGVDQYLTFKGILRSYEVAPEGVVTLTVYGGRLF